MKIMNQLTRKLHSGQVIKAAADLTRTFVITDGSVDRDGDILNPSGWDFSGWLKNPVVQAFHDYGSWPIGRGSNLRRVGDAWLADFTFATTDEGKTALALIDDGILSACSVGFLPLESAFDHARGGVNFIRQQLLEVSVVPVPANANALVQRAKALGLSADMVTKMFGAAGGLKGMTPEHRTYVHTAMTACTKAAQTLAQLLQELQADGMHDGGDDVPDDQDDDSDVIVLDDDDDDTAAARVPATKHVDRFSHIKPTDIVLDVVGLDPVGDPAARHARSRGSVSNDDFKTAFKAAIPGALSDAAAAVKKEIPSMVSREFARRRGRVD
jgi:HK97 family phage prohead protease